MFGKGGKTNPPAGSPAASTAPTAAAAPEQSSRNSNGTVNVSTQIGKGTTIDGDLQFSGGLLIEGTIKGNITAENDQATLILHEHGRIQGEVRVPSMVLNGSIDGDVFASGKVELFEKSRVCGDVYYNLLEMAVGAEVNGKLVRQKPAEPKPAAPAPVAKKEAAKKG
uniref:Cell shape determination protein CcmA n=1 Tax=uncultured Thiotrichaceae bacterium TaxID=298394 RepID=A0A6S6UEC2_9GAMM|nr:MAG: Cell shape determination protein CcmA [uncultured Thiotrichaceae bacterium]